MVGAGENSHVETGSSHCGSGLVALSWGKLVAAEVWPEKHEGVAVHHPLAPSSVSPTHDRPEPPTDGHTSPALVRSLLACFPASIVFVVPRFRFRLLPAASTVRGIF